MAQGPPNSPSEALRWLKSAVLANRYRRTRHFEEQMEARKLSDLDITALLRRSGEPTPYYGTARMDGTCWRVTGMTDERKRIAVGVEAYLDERGECALLITIFEVVKR